MITGEQKGLKIESGTVGMESARTYRARGMAVRYETIRDYRKEFRDGSFEDAMAGTLFSGQERQERGQQEKVAASDAMGDLQDSRLMQEESGFCMGLGRGERVRSKVTGSERENRSVAEDLRQITMRLIFDLLFATRRGMRRKWMEEHGASRRTTESLQVPKSASAERFRVRDILQISSYAEEEHTAFSSCGCVKTSDGREIDFKIDLAMSRSFEMTFSREIEQVRQIMKDPLVINIDVPAAQVRDQKFFFDLDADGTEEEISMLGKGSGFLALDKNGDGRIGDGSELFGTGSGDGFRDLSGYDQDGNGWIDENDDVWSELRIWAKDETGKDLLYRLSDLNVGAICLGSADTDFSLLGASGSTEGMIRRTGIFLYENGLAGTIQHLDLAT